MILLDAITKTLEVVLGGAPAANQLPFTVNYVDLDGSFTISSASETDGVTNSITAVTMLTAPVANHTRQVKFLSVYNADTVQAKIIIQINNNGTKRILCSPTIQPGETLQYAS